MADLTYHTRLFTEVDSGALKLRHWKLRVLNGPAAGKAIDLSRGSLLVGSGPGNDLLLPDNRVSRAHLEFRVLDAGLEARDLGSRNGLFLGKVRVTQCLIREPQVLRVGNTELAIEPADEELTLDEDLFCLGNLVGHSPAMRRLFGLIMRIASADVGVLIEGETGTGKELVAQEIHRLSGKPGRAPVVVDCGALPQGLVESELFGHERGAFTGAVSSRDGAFSLAHGSTLFLDEIGELPPETQPKLLRVLETSSFRTVGGSVEKQVKVRVLAATSRELTEEVNAGRFRSDLFYRLAVVRLRLPPLRERMEDLPLLVQAITEQIAGCEVQVPQATLDKLRGYAWPGNIRELRNALRQALALGPEGILELPDDFDPGRGGLGQVSTFYESPAAAQEAADYREAKRVAMDRFEVRYLTSLLTRHDWNVSAASREAGVDRNYLHRLIKRHTIRRP